MRRSINSPYVYSHKNPIPHASVLNGLVISSAISGFDLKTNKFPEKKEEQVEIAFDNMNKILKEAIFAFFRRYFVFNFIKHTHFLI